MFCFVCLVQNSIDNDQEAEHGSASKKRKTASVIVDQPAESDKVVVDQVTDVMATFEEVCYCIVPEQCRSVGKLFLNFDFFFKFVFLFKSTEWPFENFCQELCQDLFHQTWEVCL